MIMSPVQSNKHAFPLLLMAGRNGPAEGHDHADAGRAGLGALGRQPDAGLGAKGDRS